MAVEVEYNGSVIASLEVGQTATLNCAGKKMKTDFSVTVPGSMGESSGGALFAAGTFTPSSTGENTVRHGLGIVPDFIYVFGILPYASSTAITNAHQMSAGLKALCPSGFLTCANYLQNGTTLTASSNDMANASSVFGTIGATETEFTVGGMSSTLDTTKTYYWIAIGGLA